MTHAPSTAAPAEAFAEQLVALLGREHQTFSYKHFRDETHAAAAKTILAFVASPADDFAVGDVMRWFATCEVASSLMVNAIASVVAAVSSDNELVATVGDIDLFRRELADHLCEGLTYDLSRLTNARVLELAEGFAQRTAEAAAAAGKL